jgi:hypothetical protein
MNSEIATGHSPPWRGRGRGGLRLISENNFSINLGKRMIVYRFKLLSIRKI